MLNDRTAIFLINLVQDVNVLRPLVFMATRDFGFRALLLVSTQFSGRDLFGTWQTELEEICWQTGAELEIFGDDWEAHRHLRGKGLIFAASESHLPNHATTHSVFLHAPASFLRVTLQHGFECVGFRHSADHKRAHGESASFGADLVCSWYGPEQLTSMSKSQLGKLLITGPTALLQRHSDPPKRLKNSVGVVCENLHSVRLNSASGLQAEFVDAFADFCRSLEEEKQGVVLRPHPGGQYVLKNKVELPKNARINNAPMYRLDLRQFAYGISAPSSVLIDMLLAGIPTAVWRDRQNAMDADNYSGLTTVSTSREWIEFAQSATVEPERYQASQEEFLRRTGMPLEPADVFERFAELFRSARRMAVRAPTFGPERHRILFVANAIVPTWQVSFETPLSPLVGRGEIVSHLLTEEHLLRGSAIASESAASEWDRVDNLLSEFDPSIIVFCRYSGPAGPSIMSWARREGVPVVYHIDDDLLAIPRDIGQRKFEMHNATERVDSVRFLLESADLVYASTHRLRGRLLQYSPTLPIIAGNIYCSGRVLRRPVAGPLRKVGYMASADHAHNLDMVLPAIERFMDRNPDVQFELFGSIPIPAALHRFGDRIILAPPIAGYGRFLTEFSKRAWDVGICPLTPIDFNLMKADTKWVEYTSAGAAVVASRSTVYDECCAGGCGLLADGTDEWLNALEQLAHDDQFRVGMVERAQAKLEQEYNVGRLREQVLEVISEAGAHAATRGLSRQG